MPPEERIDGGELEEQRPAPVEVLFRYRVGILEATLRVALGEDQWPLACVDGTPLVVVPAVYVVGRFTSRAHDDGMVELGAAYGAVASKITRWGHGTSPLHKTFRQPSQSSLHVSLSPTCMG